MSGRRDHVHLALEQAAGLEAFLAADPELAGLAHHLGPLVAELRQRAGLLFAPTPWGTVCREDDFEVWWVAYPKKVGKKDARKAWMAAKGLPLLATLLACLEAQKATRRWQEGFAPDPAKWIRGERWNDDPTTMGRGKVDEAPAGLPASIRLRWPHMDRSERSQVMENLAIGGYR